MDYLEIGRVQFENYGIIERIGFEGRENLSYVIGKLKEGGRSGC